MYVMHATCHTRTLTLSKVMVTVKMVERILVCMSLLNLALHQVIPEANFILVKLGSDEKGGRELT